MMEEKVKPKGEIATIRTFFQSLHSSRSSGRQNPLFFTRKKMTATLCVAYAQVIALGAVFQLLATGFVPFIRNMGGATVAMIAMALGFATNIALDYVFVWALNWGMAGAAWATII